MKNLLKRLFNLCVILCALQIHLLASDGFYAYHTKVQHTATDFFNKYADLIVVLGDHKQLEFTRKTAYQPKWKTQTGEWLVDDFFPGRDKDYSFNYNFVRLIEESSEKIVVQWRYFPKTKSLDKSIEDLDPLTQNGFLGVVYELFTIYPDGRVLREMRDANGTSNLSWNDPANRVKQELQLTNSGIEHSKVEWEQSSVEWKPVKGRIEVEVKGIPQPVAYLDFNEGMSEEFENYVFEEYEEEELPVEGLMSVFKEGVSGTALAFDGYYTAVRLRDSAPKLENEMTAEGWVALDVYPYNDAPIVHQSKNFGEEGYYLGIDPYGNAFFRLNGITVKSTEALPLYKWQHVAATANGEKLNLYVNGKQVGTESYVGKIDIHKSETVVGLNTDKASGSDYVRTPLQNIPFIFGIQGVIDEVKLYNKSLSAADITNSYSQLVPDDLTSPIAIGVLPGEVGSGKKFGAYYKTLPYHELWDNMWRMDDYSDIVVKFGELPTSVVYWRGTNYAANWVTEKNQWMSDQSSEIWGPHGCSEHMADKQVRHSYARIIENTPARVVIHWRYPCVDVGYICLNKKDWSDELHTIYPDGSGIRKVFWNKKYDKPGFQDIQFLTNPGESALDVVDLQAMDVANIDGDIEKLQWKKPNVSPKITIDNATIELLNSKSNHKIFVIFQGGKITPWGDHEQSAYTDDPFAGPWNHWPMHFIPSDGRYAIGKDRVSHFALAANDWAPQFGSLVQYGFTEQSIESVISKAKYWQNPPEVLNVKGAENKGFSKDEKAFKFVANNRVISFSIEASDDSPLVNPAFVINNWGSLSDAIVKINGKEVKPGLCFRQGNARDTEGKLKKVIWLELNTDSKTEVIISKL